MIQKIHHGVRYFTLPAECRDEVRQWLVDNLGPKKFHLHNNWEGGDKWRIGGFSPSGKEFYIAVDSKLEVYLQLRFG